MDQVVILVDDPVVGSSSRQKANECGEWLNSQRILLSVTWNFYTHVLWSLKHLHICIMYCAKSNIPLPNYKK